MAASCWWLIIMGNVYLTYHHKITPNNRLQWAVGYNLFAWGLPTLLTTIGYAIAGFNANTPLIICFLPLLDSSPWIQYGLFYIPVALITCAGFLVLILIKVDLVKTYLNVKGAVTQNIRPYVKLCLFGVMFFVVWASVFFTRLYISTQEDSVAQGFMNWIECQTTAFILNMPHEQCGEVPPRFSASTINYYVFILSSPGFLLFCYFCFDKQTYDGWKYLFWLFCKKLQERNLLKRVDSNSPRSPHRVFTTDV